MTIQPYRETTTTDKRRLKDQNAILTRSLAPLAQIVGHEVVLQTIKGDILSLDVEREHLLAVCRFLRDQLGFDLLSSISGVDMLDHLEVVYHVRALASRHLLQLRVRIDVQGPEVESVVSIWPGANWLEREVYDLFGIHFPGHPDLRRIFLDDDFEGYPLLKSFEAVPPTIRDPATTQVDPNAAIEKMFQVRGYEQAGPKLVGQGMEERLHPGTPTFGDTQEGSQRGANLNRER